MCISPPPTPTSLLRIAYFLYYGWKQNLLFKMPLEHSTFPIKDKSAQVLRSTLKKKKAQNKFCIFNLQEEKYKLKHIGMWLIIWKAHKVCLSAGGCTSLLWPCSRRSTLAVALRPLFALILEGLVSHWPGSHHFSETEWPESLRDHPASIPTQKFNHTTNPADLLHGCWKSNTGPPAWEASTLAMQPTPWPHHIVSYALASVIE